MCSDIIARRLMEIELCFREERNEKFDLGCSFVYSNKIA